MNQGQFGSHISAMHNQRTKGTEDFNFVGGKTGSKITKNYKNDGVVTKNKLPFLQKRGDAPILEMMRTGPNNNPSGMDEGSNVNEQETNTVVAVNRRAMKMASTYPAIGVNEAAFIYNNIVGSGMKKRESKDLELSAIFSPEIYNYLSFEEQLDMSVNSPDEFLKLTPYDIFKYYSFDGVPESEKISADGSCSKFITMVKKGPVSMFNYWGTGIRPGAELYFVIKKFAQAETEFNLSYSSALIGPSNLKKIETVNPIRPFQLGFFSLPYGGPVPSEIRKYFAESGDICYDGYVQKVGIVSHVPRNHVFKENKGPIKAFTGISNGVGDGIPRGNGFTHLFHQNTSTSLMTVILCGEPTFGLY